MFEPSEPRSAPRVHAIAVDQLVKVYKTTRAVDGISFALEQGSWAATAPARPPRLR